jgi:hypothetical protein
LRVEEKGGGGVGLGVATRPGQAGRGGDGSSVGRGPGQRLVAIGKEAAANRVSNGGAEATRNRTEEGGGRDRNGRGGCGADTRCGRERKANARGRLIHRRAEKVGTSFCLHFVLFSSRDHM